MLIREIPRYNGRCFRLFTLSQFLVRLCTKTDGKEQDLFLRDGLTIKEAAKKIGVPAEYLPRLGVAKKRIDLRKLKDALRNNIPAGLKLRAEEERNLTNALGAIVGRLCDERNIFGLYTLKCDPFAKETANLLGWFVKRNKKEWNIGRKHFRGGPFDFEAMDFCGKDLAGFNISGCHLSKSLFNGAILTGADLSGSLTGYKGVADFSGANLTYATLENAHLRGANFDRALLIKSVLRNAGLNKASLKSANLSGADLSRANLEGADLSGTIVFKAKLQDVQATDACCSKAFLNKADFTRSCFSGAFLAEADISDASVDRAYFRGTDFTGANASRVDFSRIRSLENAIFIRTTLAGAKFNGLDLWTTDFSWAFFDGTDFTNAAVHVDLYRYFREHSARIIGFDTIRWIDTLCVFPMPAFLFPSRCSEPPPFLSGNLAINKEPEIILRKIRTSQKT